ncbi:type IV secretory system conjugative DNA transfer family protein [Streptantibioticus silvisoli]|uniref:type IV secretory system conjugative DNA transfer family protein n=1 Tax=Streptantibioticus silvisoli TaxID=2705255 RepID=UPI003556DDD3
MSTPPPGRQGPRTPTGGPRQPHGPRGPQDGGTQPSRREGGLPDGLLLLLIGFLLGITVLVWTGTGLAALINHGHWPAGLHFTRTPLAMRDLIGAPDGLGAAWPDTPAADLPHPGLFWGVLISQIMILLVVAVFAVGTLTRYRAVRTARRRAPQQPSPTTAYAPEPAPARPATAPTPVPAVPVEAVTAEREPEAEPQPEAVAVAVPAPAPAYATAPTGPPPGQLTTSCVVFTGAGPARAETGKRVVQPAVLDAEGAVLVTCADAGTWQQTVAVRGKLGPVHVFDPEHLVDTPARLRWAPHTGCEDPGTARERAAALLAPLRTHDITTNDAAATLLRCWLHAAAVDGLPFRQLHRWAGNSGSADAVRILRTARGAASGWSGELESTLHAHPERRDAAQAVIQRALSCLTSLHMRDACSPGRNDGLDLESFVAERGTLYVVGTRREDPRTDAGAMPLLTALVSCVVEHGRRMAAESSPGRLDPPVTLVLDDVATTAPLPQLPALMREGAALGLPALAVLRSEEQARHRWPGREAPALWRDAGLRVDL